ncbi:MAG: tetratricopeptide repeat protein [Legionella sp.]|jgi:predicted nucleotidyltransferase
MFNKEIPNHTFDINSQWQLLQKLISDNKWPEATNVVVSLQAILAKQFDLIESALITQVRNNQLLPINSISSLFPDIKLLAQPENMYLRYLQEMRAFVRKALEDPTCCIQAILSHITVEAKVLIQRMLEKIIITHDLGKPPAYAIVLLGSMSRNEMTPTSDLEFIILIKDDEKLIMERQRQYFKLLIELFRLAIIRLNETPFYDDNDQVVFGVKGFMLDRTKIPISAAINGGLILTPTELAEFHKEDDEHFIHRSNCHLSEALLSASYLNFDDEDKNAEGWKLWDAYQSEMKKIYSSSKEFKLKHLLRLLKFDTINMGELLKTWKSEVPNIKRHVYRFITNLLDILAMYHEIKNNNSWERLKHLSVLIDPLNTKELETTLDKIGNLRLKISLQKNIELSESDQIIFNSLYKIMNDIHQSAKEFCDHEGNFEQCSPFPFIGLFRPKIFASLPTASAVRYKSLGMKNIEKINNINRLCEPFIQRHASTDLKLRIQNIDKNVVEFAIIGISGSGKSELAKNFAIHNETNIAWEFDAESDESLWESYVVFAKMLILHNTKQTQDMLGDINLMRRNELIRHVNQLLLLYSDWIFIFDDAKSYPQICNYIPKHHLSKGIVLITSQNDILNNPLLVLNLSEGFTPNEASELLSTITTLKDNAGANYLADRLDYLPLPLCIAAQHIYNENNCHHQKLSYISYMEKYIPHHDEEIPRYNAQTKRIFKSNLSIKKDQATTIQAALKVLLPDYSKLLQFCAYIKATNIPPTLLHRYIKATHLKIQSEPNLLDPEDILIGLTEENESRSLLNRSISDSTTDTIFYYIHKTTQEQIRFFFKEELNDQFFDMVLQVIIEEIKSGIVSDHDYFHKSELLPHLKSILEHIPITYKSKQTALAYHLLGRLYKENGSAATALIYYEKSHSILNEIGLCENILMGLLYNDMGRASQALAQFEKAKYFYDQAYVLFAHLEPNEANSHMPKLLSNLGMVCHDLAKSLNKNEQKFDYYNQGQEYLQKAVQIVKKEQDHENPDLIEYLNNLGEIQRSLGDLNNALLNINNALDISKRFFSQKPNRLLSVIYFNLGRTYRKTGNIQDACDCFANAERISTIIYGETHPLVARHRDALGKAWLLLGDISKAKQLFNSASLILIKTREKNHPLHVAVNKHLEQCIRLAELPATNKN